MFRGVRTITGYDKRFRIKVNVDDWIQQQVFFFGIYDEPAIRYIKKNLKPDDIFFDIGANIGLFSISASEVLQKDKGGVVYAFEPVSHVFDRFRENIALNNLNNIIPRRMAVYEKNTSIDLFVSNRENQGMSSIFHHDHENGSVEKVEAVSLDDFIFRNGIKKVSLIKIDIEGAELYALRGMIKTLEHFRPVLLLEVSESLLEGKEKLRNELFKFLENFGYKPYKLDEKGDIHSLNNLSGIKQNNYVFVNLSLEPEL